MGGTTMYVGLQDLHWPIPDLPSDGRLHANLLLVVLLPAQAIASCCRRKAHTKRGHILHVIGRRTGLVHIHVIPLPI